MKDQNEKKSTLRAKVRKWPNIKGAKCNFPLNEITNTKTTLLFF